MDLFETETAGFWKAPGVNPADIKTEVFMLPAVDAMEKAGSIVTSGRRINWRPAVASGPGQAKPDIWIIDRLFKAVKAAYAGSTATKDRPILDLVWGYETTKDEPDVELIAREINGYALEDVKDSTDKVLVAKGKLIPGFATIASAANPDAIACGCWIHSGYWADADDGSGILKPAVKRRGQKDPGGLGIYPNWGFQWPANRKILYNRCSARPDGTPWSEKKALIWWDANADSGTKDAEGKPVLGKWVGYDVPDFAPTKKPDAKANPAGTGLAAQAGTDPFIMKADGKGWLFAPKGLAEGPLPEHYEPLESPVKNPMSSVQNNPVIKVFNTDADQDVGDKVGTPEEFPIVCTTYRLTEHWQTGTMSRTLPWLAETQPEMFLEISKELAEEKGISNGEQIVVRSARGEIQMVAMVTGRWKPLNINGQRVHQVGMPWHYGWMGLATGPVANDLTPHVGDGNTGIPEFKAFLVDVRKA
jgi:formate dehydrogenase major subunit